MLQLVQSLAWVWRHAAELRRRPVAHRRRRPFRRRPPGGDDAVLRLAGGRARPARRIWCSGALAVSGVFELEPLRHAPFLAPDLRLDAAVGAPPQPGPDAGAARPRSSPSSAPTRARSSGARTRLIARGLGRARGAGRARNVPGRHHMDVLHELADPSSRHASAGAAAARPLRPKPPSRDAARAPPAAPADRSGRRTARTSRPTAPRRGSG